MSVRDAPPSDAQNVTESRKRCEVPSCPSFPQDVARRIAVNVAKLSALLKTDVKPF
jgi:hypothetical protein